MKEITLKEELGKQKKARKKAKSQNPPKPEEPKKDRKSQNPSNQGGPGTGRSNVEPPKPERHRRTRRTGKPERTAGPEQKEATGKKRGKTVLMISGILVLILVAVYLGIGLYYSERFFPGSTVNGLDASGKTVEQVENMIANRVQDYTLVIHEKEDAVEQIDGADIRFEYVSDGTVQELKNTQNSFLWVQAYFDPQEYTMTTPTTYDKEKLKEVMKGLDAFDEEKVVKPQDAYIDETSDGYVMVPEVEGNQLDEEKVYDLLCTAVDEGKTEIDLTEQGCYLKPEKTSDNKKLNKKLAALQKYWSLTVTYNIGTAQEVLDYQTFRDWMTVSGKGEVSFDWNHIADWIAQLADKYDTFGKDQTFHTSLGETVTVQSETYGWKLDEETEAAWLEKTLKAGKSEERDPQWLESAFARGEENDIGDTYVEIDITNQRMWFYKDGTLLVDTPVVTGDATKSGYETPVGLYCLYNKEYMAILRGADNLTGKSYNTPVDYWMPFNGGIGIHDAKWRGSFGGAIYQGNGSHGCVNTPWDKAQIIYNNIDIGTPIVVYKSSVNQGTGAVGVSQPAETRVINEKGEEVTGTQETGSEQQSSESAATYDATAIY